MATRMTEAKSAAFKLVGEWDFSRRDELQNVLRAGETADEVFIDFSEAPFIDASVVGVLIGLLNRMIERNGLGAIRIVSASPQVTRILEVCRLQALFGLSAAANESSRYPRGPLDSSACDVRRVLVANGTDSAPSP